MASALTILTQLSLLLFAGILGSAIAKRAQMSNILILIMMGLIIGKVTDFFAFEPVFLISLAVFTLVLVVFEGTSKLSYRQVDLYSGPALKLTMWFILFTIVVITILAYLFFFYGQPGAIILSLILAFALSGTDPSSVLLILKDSTGSLIRVMTLEAVINTPIVVLIPFILTDTLTASVFTAGQLIDVIEQVVVGIGAGVFVGLVLSRVLRRFYSKEISPVVVIAGSLLCYILAENLGGSGVLSVATMGVIFGNFSIKEKESLQDFSSGLSNILEFLIFLLIGIMIGGSLDLTWGFIGSSLILFIGLFLARLTAAYITLKETHSRKEIVFCAITMPKGIAVAVLIFSFALVPEIPQSLLAVLFVILIYSILAATLAGWWWNLSTKQSRKDAS